MRTAGTIPAMMDAAATICEIGRRAYQRGLVGGGEGNLSIRLDETRVLCTPSGPCKGFLAPADLCIVDLDGQQISGTRPRSSEIRMHLEIYREDERVRAVCHAHPPYATTFAVLGEELPTGVLPEGDVFLGRTPLIPYVTPGTIEVGRALRPFVQNSCSALLQNHGAVTWGRDLESAYLLMETLECVARVLHQARQIGKIGKIPQDKVAELQEIRARMRSTE